MRYSLDRIEANSLTIMAIKSLLVCQNCNKVDSSNSYTQQKCHSGSYCLDCLNKCPNCCKIQCSIHPELLQILATVSVKCMYYLFGCKATAPYGKIEEHEKHCTLNREWPKFIPSNPINVYHSPPGAMGLMSNNKLAQVNFDYPYPQANQSFDYLNSSYGTNDILSRLDRLEAQSKLPQLNGSYKKSMEVLEAKVIELEKSLKAANESNLITQNILLRGNLFGQI
jgi:hypothetical protein